MLSADLLFLNIKKSDKLFVRRILIKNITFRYSQKKQIYILSLSVLNLIMYAIPTIKRFIQISNTAV